MQPRQNVYREKRENRYMKKKMLVKKLAVTACMAGMVMGLTGCHLSIWGYAVDKAKEDIQADSEEAKEYSSEDDFSATDNTTESQTTEKGFLDEDVTEEQGTEEEQTEEATTQQAVSEDTTETAGNADKSLTNSTLDPEVQSVLDSLTSDYNKIVWGSVYSVIDKAPAIVVSVTPCMTYDRYALLVAVTNLYNEPMAFSGMAQAKGSGDEVVGETYFSEDCIGPGSTVVRLIYCGDTISDGRIHWTDCMAYAADGSAVEWEGDYVVTGNASDGSLTVDYNIYATDGSSAKLGEVAVVLLDENGMAVSAAEAYPDDIPAGGKAQDSATIYSDPDMLNTVKDVAVFANPVAE